MSLKNLFDRENEEKAASACGTACGTADKKSEEKPAACGTACGTGDKKPATNGAGIVISMHSAVMPHSKKWRWMIC